MALILVIISLSEVIWKCLILKKECLNSGWRDVCSFELILTNYEVTFYHKHNARSKLEFHLVIIQKQVTDEFYQPQQVPWGTYMNVWRNAISRKTWPHSLSGKTSYRKIPWILDAVRFGFILLQSLRNFTGTSVAMLSRCLSHFRAIRSLQHSILCLRDFMRFGGKTPYRLVNRGPYPPNKKLILLMEF